MRIWTAVMAAFLMTMLLQPASAGELKCRKDHRQEICYDTNGDRWKGRPDHRGRMVYENENTRERIRVEPRQATRGDAVKLRNMQTLEEIARTRPRDNNGRNWLETRDGRSWVCWKNHRNEKQCI